MDKKTRYKEAGGASSDEDEAFESADEGEEGSKSSRPSFATSAGDDSSNSTSKDLVGKNDTSEKPLAISASDKNLETTELDKEVPKMAENMAEETKAAEDIPSVVTESSPKDVSGNSEEGNKEETDSSSIKDTEDEKRDSEIEKENEQKQESGEEKSSTTGMEQAEESSAGRDSQGQNRQNEQSSAVLDQEPFKENVESSTSSASDIEPIRYSVLV